MFEEIFRMSPAAAFRQELFDPRKNRYDARLIARKLDWSDDAMAFYLDLSLAELRGDQVSPRERRRIRVSVNALVDVIVELAELVEFKPDLLRQWLATSVKVFDGKSPKEEILLGRLDKVASVLKEIRSGMAL